MMNINFPLILVVAVLVCGLIWLVDAVFFARRRNHDKVPIIVDYAQSFFPILVIVLLLRSFLFEPFRIPSSSLEPTLLPGDFILVNKFDYGLRWPVLDKKFVEIGNPQLGDIVVFHWPPNPSIDYIKRVVGVPGDHIKYIDKILYVNNRAMSQKKVGEQLGQDEYGNTWKVDKMEENLNGVKHYIYLRPETPASNFADIVVPPNQYFMMGDNRDDSQDSRYWGFVPDQNLVGKAVAVWFSWDKNKYRVRWQRIGKVISQEKP